MRANRIPSFSLIHPFTKRSGNYIVNLPINQGLDSVTYALPPMVVSELIRRARYHVILDACLCRTGRACEKHPHDIGCLFLGRSGLEVPPGYSRRVSEADALSHVERAVQAGLVPMTVRARVDNYAFLLPDRHALLGVCFCCSCCCIMGNYRYVRKEHLNEIFPRLDGLEIEVSDDCTGCSTCVETCYMQSIRIEGGRAVHDETCRGCGRCAAACPQGAVAIRITDEHSLAKTVDRFLALARID
ncbi:MAG TPA: 4Fe-4S dicluster domain-containing protein [Desulfomonilia bacterium]|nr:4Fe-4S dicluster domain-containing protein [Desulfomonilia bacterium]